VSGGFIVGGKATCPVEGLSIRTFAEDGVHRFLAKGKRARAVELVIHETVTRSVDSTIAVLTKRGLSVHLVMGADGALTQHGDLATDILDVFIVEDDQLRYGSKTAWNMATR
jgi:hypothetical protein